MATFNKFNVAYAIIKRRHSNWSKRRIRSCAVYAIKTKR